MASTAGTSVDGPLSAARCDAMLRSSQHLLHNMWAVEAWLVTSNQSNRCWSVDRENWQRRQPASSFFDGMVSGRFCDSNWYRGNAGELGRRKAPNYTAPAPALLGYDPAVDWACV